MICSKGKDIAAEEHRVAAMKAQKIKQQLSSSINKL